MKCIAAKAWRASRGASGDDLGELWVSENVAQLGQERRAGHEYETAIKRGVENGSGRAPDHPKPRR